MTSINNFFASCFQDKRLLSFKSAQKSIVTTALDRLATNPNERIDVNNIPGVIQQILKEMGEADWENVINDLYQERERGVQEHEARLNTLLSCRRCGIQCPLRELRNLEGIPGSHSLYCQSCADKTVEEYTKVCCLCGNMFIIANLGITFELCSNCYSPEIVREHQRVRSHLKRARELDLPATLKLSQWLATLDYFEWLCAYCKREFTDLEHFIPLVAGSSTAISNCIPSCGRCNTRKNNRHPDELDSVFPADNLARIREYLASVAVVAV